MPLEIEAKIPLGAIKGRIDHLAVDLPRRRLFVAELGNDTIGVVDLDAREKRASMTGLQEPQGVAYQASSPAISRAISRSSNTKINPTHGSTNICAPPAKQCLCSGLGTSRRAQP